MRRQYTRQCTEPPIDRTDSDPNAAMHLGVQHMSSEIVSQWEKAKDRQMRQAQALMIEDRSMVVEREELDDHNHVLVRICQELEAHCDEQQGKLHVLERELATAMAH